MSFDVHYSGTVGAACEATLLGIQSIAVSLTDLDTGSFDHAANFTRKLVQRCLQTPLATNTDRKSVV